jgi:cytidine deaminase
LQKSNREPPSKASCATIDPEDLIRQAREALRFAYAPYSRFKVAAVVVDDEGNSFQGVNVENASYGLTICAERAAIFSAISQGARRIRAVAISCEEIEGLAPCGACRQVMLEFCDADAKVFSDTGARGFVEWTVGELSPHAFTSKDVPRK